MVKLKKALGKSYLYIVLLIMYAPLIVLFILSFTYTSVFGKWAGFSMKSYADVFTGKESPKLFDAIGNTLILALISGVIATILGTLAAIGVFNMKKRTKRILMNFNQLPIINAEIVTAVSLMIFFASLSFKPGWFTLIVGHVSFCTPYVLLSVLPRLQQINPNVYEAALDLGASPMRALISVTFPMILPGVISGFLLALTISLDDFVITIFNNGNVNTLSTYIWYDASKRGLSPSTKAVSVLIFVLIYAILLAVNIWKAKKHKGEVKK